jgi:hypothetical protein
MYSTSGMLRTIELILGLPPMSQYDAAATPMWNCFQPMPDSTAYTAQNAIVDISQRNAVWNKEAKQSALFNFAKADAAPDRLLNEIIWKAIKGSESRMPEPRRSAFVKLSPVKDDDD